MSRIRSKVTQTKWRLINPLHELFPSTTIAEHPDSGDLHIRSCKRGEWTLPCAERKTLGAFYTDTRVADFLVWWAVRTGTETVLDPCFGGGVFLRSACERLQSLGGNPGSQVFGVEIDPYVHDRVSKELLDEYPIITRNLIRADFFAIKRDMFPAPNVIVGNPPFIRYQLFTGGIREAALNSAAEQGVSLSRLCSSWAPFLVHSVAHLQPGGRLAMVVPAEIGHATYARPVVLYLKRSFRTITLLTFRKRLFPGLSEDTFLLLAEDKGCPHEGMHWRDLDHVEQLSEMKMMLAPSDLEGISAGNGGPALGEFRMAERFIPTRAQELYMKLKRLSCVRKLGELADVGIGYVTGSNEFFHLSAGMTEKYRIPLDLLRPVVRRGRDLVGIRYTADDWRDAKARGEAVYLLDLRPDRPLPDQARWYIRQGELAGIHRAYKCRTRSPWYCVPHVYQPDAFLSYMSGDCPRMVSNGAGAVAPNTLHVVRLKGKHGITGDDLAVSWQTSLTMLSCEIEGHSLGGGMLKLEPGEARNVLVPLLNKDEIGEIGNKIDALQRCGQKEEARKLADRCILQEKLGLSEEDIRVLREARNILFERRTVRRLKG
ncbi:MAG: N-6 DNA methylase [Bacteroidota bacterium]